MRLSGTCDRCGAKRVPVNTVTDVTLCWHGQTEPVDVECCAECFGELQYEPEPDEELRVVAPGAPGWMVNDGVFDSLPEAVAARPLSPRRKAMWSKPCSTACR